MKSIGDVSLQESDLVQSSIAAMEMGYGHLNMMISAQLINGCKMKKGNLYRLKGTYFVLYVYNT